MMMIKCSWVFPEAGLLYFCILEAVGVIRKTMVVSTAREQSQLSCSKTENGGLQRGQEGRRHVAGGGVALSRLGRSEWDRQSLCCSLLFSSGSCLATFSSPVTVHCLSLTPRCEGCLYKYASSCLSIPHSPVLGSFSLRLFLRPLLSLGQSCPAQTSFSLADFLALHRPIALGCLFASATPPDSHHTNERITSNTSIQSQVD